MIRLYVCTYINLSIKKYIKNSKQKSIICYITTKYFKVSVCKFIRSDTVGTKYFLLYQEFTPKSDSKLSRELFEYLISE